MKERMKLRIEKSKVRSINRTSFGFTLIELSIVLIIISLIVAGITGGKALIRQAEIRSVTNDIQSFKTSVNTFRLQYGAVPGDFDEASQYWGGAGDDGNNDGVVNFDEPIPAQNERMQVWQHLSLAELIPGNYDGTGLLEVLGTNTPESDVDAAGYMYSSAIDWGGTGYSFFGTDPEKSLIIFAKVPSGGGIMTDPALSPADAAAIDIKNDDGKADSGKIFGHENILIAVPAAGTGCLIGTAGPYPEYTAGEYNLALGSTEACILIFTDNM